MVGILIMAPLTIVVVSLLLLLFHGMLIFASEVLGSPLLRLLVSSGSSDVFPAEVPLCARGGVCNL